MEFGLKWTELMIFGVRVTTEYSYSVLDGSPELQIRPRKWRPGCDLFPVLNSVLLFNRGRPPQRYYSIYESAPYWKKKKKLLLLYQKY